MKKYILPSVALFATSLSTFAETASSGMTADPATGLTSIQGYADSAIGVAIAIGVVVVGWGYVKRLVKKG